MATSKRKNNMRITHHWAGRRSHTVRSVGCIVLSGPDIDRPIVFRGVGYGITVIEDREKDLKKALVDLERSLDKWSTLDLVFYVTLGGLFFFALGRSGLLG